MKTYDRDKVLSVAAQLYPFFAGSEAHEDGSQENPCFTAVEVAQLLIDEVERQCPLPGKPEPYNQPVRVMEMLADCDQPSDDETYNAWELATKYVARTAPLEVADVIELARAYYAKPGNSCGGPLHLVLDDCNLADEHVAFCRAEAERIGDADGVAICDKMARWPVRWRRIVAEAVP